ncbi:MAG TPA: tetratricopeptide repeat protein [Candidatus Limnocylindrales bacterium]|nr:tetratricopeptide repeat protein [Candidatus Limnocylindrales bacterium]
MTDRLAGAKVRLPSPPPWGLPRAAAQLRLDQIPRHRLTTVVGGAGFGKSTVVAAWARDRDGLWYTLDAADRRLNALVAGVVAALQPFRPTAASQLARVLLHGQGDEADIDEAERARSCAAIVSDALAQEPGDDLVIVFDDFEEIEDAPAAVRFVESFVRLAPPDIHPVLVSRRPIPFPVDRLRGQGQLLEIDDELLAFTVDEVSEVLNRIIGPDGAELAPVVHASTDGWPAAVILAAQSLHDTPPARRPAALRRLQRPEGPLFAYIAAEALAHVPDDAIAWLRVAALFERFSAELLEAVGRAPEGGLAHGGRPSVFLQHLPDDPGWYRLHSLIREYVIARLPVPEAELQDVQRRAAAFFEARGMADEALQAYAAVGDAEAIGRLLRDRGPAMVEAGHVDRVVAAEASLPEDLRGPGSELLFGDALLAQGDWTAALAAYMRAGAGDGTLPSGLAWRIGLIHYLRGDLDAAATTFDSATTDGISPNDDAMALAWGASVAWLRGDAARTAESARRALAIAEGTRDDRALAASHMAMALVALQDGDMRASEGYHRTAEAHAEAAGDVLQLVRVRDNLGDHLLEQGRYTEALEALDGAVRLAEVLGFPAYQALALANRGQAQLELGHFDEAFADFRASKSLYQRLGSTWVAYAIVREARVHLLRGDDALARAAYEDAIRIAGATGDRQIQVPALIGLAMTVAREEPARARELVDQALSVRHGVAPMMALVGGARVALMVGDPAIALARAEEAIAIGWERRDRPHVARALEARAMATAPTDRARALEDFDRALGIWRDCGSPPGEAWNYLSRAFVLEGAERLAAAHEAERRFAELGARGLTSQARAIAEVAERTARPPVTIEALGGFRVLRAGVPVPITEWQSRKARDLLKMLVARRGRPAAREALIEALWPDDDPGPLGNRFSVALSTVRNVLDPERAFPPDHFIVADKGSVALVAEHLDLDLARFAAAVEDGRRLERAGRAEEALERYREAIAMYGGDFLEEDPFEEWSIAPRDEAQAAYLAILRSVARHAAAEGDDAAATGLYLRILERDQFDEAAHLSLIGVLHAAGRHGEARRRYATYQARMEEIGVEAASFPTPAASELRRVPA